MFISTLLRGRFIIIAALALLLATAAYGFAAANTVPDTNAGSGVGAVSGFDTSSITYTMDATDPSKIASIAFDLSPAGTTNRASSTTKIEVQFMDSSSATVGSLYTTCTQAGTGNGWSCTTSSTKADAAQVESLLITAHD
jgi:hypothetical protein